MKAHMYSVVRRFVGESLRFSDGSVVPSFRPDQILYRLASPEYVDVDDIKRRYFDFQTVEDRTYDSYKLIRYDGYLPVKIGDCFIK